MIDYAKYVDETCFKWAVPNIEDLKHAMKNFNQFPELIQL